MNQPKNEIVTVELPSCPICAEHYTSVVRKKVNCNSCRKETCSKCVEKYMMSTVDDPHCMHCRSGWNRAFLTAFLSATFLNKTYYAYRQTVLLNREKSFLPQYQGAAERTMRVRTLEKEDVAIRERYDEVEKRCREELYAISRERTALWHRIQNVRAGREEAATGGAGREEASSRVAAKFIRRCTSNGCNGFLSSAWKCGLCSLWACPDCFEIKGADRDTAHTCTADALATAALIRKDTKPCPSCGEMISKIDGCFAPDTPVLRWDGSTILAKDVQVGDVLIGDDGTPRTVQTTCTGEDEMYEVRQSDGMTYTINSKHTLVLFDIELKTIVHVLLTDWLSLSNDKQSLYRGVRKQNLSTLEIVSVGRGTYHGWSLDGNKRFVLKDYTISKNCDQMFCTSCHKPFSWNTGQSITTGAIHNPHYFQWLAKGGLAAPANPGFVPCGGLPNPYHVQTVIQAAPKDDRKKLLEILRACTHVSDVERHRYERHLNPVNNEELGVQFLLKEKCEDAWKLGLARQEKDRQKCNEIRDILEAFHGATIDVFRRIEVGRAPYTQEEARALIKSICTELEALRQFIFQSMLDVSKSFNCSVPLLNETWQVEHGNIQILNRRKKQAAEAEAAAAAAAAAAAEAAAAEAAATEAAVAAAAELQAVRIARRRAAHQRRIAAEATVAVAPVTAVAPAGAVEVPIDAEARAVQEVADRAFAEEVAAEGEEAPPV